MARLASVMFIDYKALKVWNVSRLAPGPGAVFARAFPGKVNPAFRFGNATDRNPASRTALAAFNT
jgi:hypothetical protein